MFQTRPWSKYTLQIPVITLVLLFSVVTPVFSQDKKAVVSGSVTDSLSFPLGYATISLFKPGILLDSPLVRTYTNDKGNFRFAADTGNYLLLITYASFKEMQKEISIHNGQNALGNLVLSPSVHTLRDVTITSRKLLIEQSDDKIIYNVELDPAAKGESASELLRKTPLVTVDGDGNVQLNGQSNFKVLLNGRETAIFAQNLKDALKSFPASMITRVEVITTPSAKYDAEGVGGIINIITRKKIIGYNGSFSNYYSTLTQFLQSLSFNIKTGKLGISTSFNQSGPFNDITGMVSNITTPLTPSVFTRRSLEGTRRYNNYGAYSNLEVSYDIDSLRIITVYGNLNRMRSRSALDQLIFTEYAAQSASGSHFMQESYNTVPSSGIGMDFIVKGRTDPNKEFSLRFNSQFYNNNGYSNSEQDNSTMGKGRYISNLSETGNKEYTLQTDFVKPLRNSSRLETGIKIIWRSAFSDFAGRAKYHVMDPYQNSAANSDNFNYRQNVYSTYASFNTKIKNYAIRLGLRMEYTDIHSEFATSKTEIDQQYVNLVPNLLISRKVNPVYTFTLSYNMRLQRPYIANLNPFINNNDSLSVSFGNPTLVPQTIHTGSLQNRFISGNFFGSVTFHGSYTDNMIVQYASFDKSTGVTSTTSGNVGKEFQLSMAINMSTAIGSKLNIGSNSVIRYNKIENQLLVTQRANGFSGNFSGYFNYKVIGKFTISGNAGVTYAPRTFFNYTAPQVFYQVNFGYKFFNEKLAATINFNNFSRKYFSFRTTTEDTGFRSVYTNENPYRVIFFGVTYYFGKLKTSVSRKKGIVNDDLVSQ
jgi:hypothetical protein